MVTNPSGVSSFLMRLGGLIFGASLQSALTTIFVMGMRSAFYGAPAFEYAAALQIFSVILFAYLLIGFPLLRAFRRFNIGNFFGNSVVGIVAGGIACALFLLAHWTLHIPAMIVAKDFAFILSAALIASWVNWFMVQIT